MLYVKKKVPKFPLRTEQRLLGNLPDRIGVDVKTCRAIMADYFEMAWNAVLAGHKWYFPGGNTLYIGCEDEPGVSFAKFKPGGKVVRAYNARRLNKRYRTYFTGPLAEEKHLKLYKPKSVGARMFKVLTQTDVEFRYKENEH